MCGIIGYKGYQKASKILLEGVRQLEYRGYDSVGMAILKNGILEIKKEVGKVEEVNKKLNFENLEGNMGIAHTRWSTHGAVTKANAHPHPSDNNSIAVVHNGIIENFQELKEFLEEEGINFRSETDTEVIPNLIQHFMEDGEDFREAFRQSLLKLEGSFAVVAMHKSYDFLLFARKDSPLVLGIGNNEYFIGSDIPAFLNYTNRVIYLENNEYGILDKDFEIFTIDTNKQLKKEQTIIQWTTEQAQKGNYPHFMLKEINEQRTTINKAIEQSQELIKKVAGMIQNAYGVFFTGCGTSYHACISTAYQFAEICKKHVNVVLSSEFRNYEDFLTDKTLLIAVSQSGETADVLDAVKIAKQHGVKIIAIVNVMGSTLTRLADETIMMNSGPEICVLSTKSYTSQLAILLLLAYATINKTEEGKELIKKANSMVDKIITDNTATLKELAKNTKHSHDYFLIGRDLAYPSALEGALKIKEVSYIHAEGFAGAELKHGTIALIENGTPAIVLSTEKTRKSIISNAAEIKSRGGYIIGIDSENNNIYDYFIKIPDVNQANPILMIIPIQILAYYLALEKGCDPDKPRNLAKSVTVK